MEKHLQRWVDRAKTNRSDRRYLAGKVEKLLQSHQRTAWRSQAALLLRILPSVAGYLKTMSKFGPRGL